MRKGRNTKANTTKQKGYIIIVSAHNSKHIATCIHIHMFIPLCLCRREHFLLRMQTLLKSDTYIHMLYIYA